VPDAISPVRAWRKWLLWRLPSRTEDEEEIRIGSSPRPGYLWPPLLAEPAVCRRHKPCEGAPSQGCTCGYYGVQDEAFVETMECLRAVPFVVLGSVYLWGRLIVGERGWRAEFAYPDRLYLPSDAGWGDAKLRHHVKNLTSYGVPVQAERLEAIVKAARRRNRT